MTTEKIKKESEISEITEAPKNILSCWNEALHMMFTYNGRTSRYDFWAFQSVSLVIFLLLALGGYFFGEPKIVVNIFAFYFLLSATSISIRRLHDLSLSGFWYLPLFILSLIVLGMWNFDSTTSLYFLLSATLVYGSFLLWIMCGRGTTDANKYGNAVNEPVENNLDSRAFICFISAFLIGLWLIFLTHVW